MRISVLALLLAVPVSSAAAQAPKAEAEHSCPCPHHQPSRVARADPPPPPVIDSVVPDGGYDIGMAEMALGTHYRHLWATKIGVPVLDLKHYAGGLTPLKKGGGRQTLGLHLKGRDGVTYKFRSVKKAAGQALPTSLRKTVVEKMLQDQMSSLHPAAAVIASALMDASGVPHTRPTMYLMPDDPALGKFRKEFGGVLGTIEAALPPMEGAKAFVGSDDLFDSLRNNPLEHIDAPAYVRARLMDLLMGDWDRHPDNVKWASFTVGDEVIWEVIPSDRDWAFSRLDGWIATLVRQFYPQTIGFADDYPPMLNLMWTAKELDRRLLPVVDRKTWDAIALDLQHRITDSVIAAAVASQPAPLAAKSGKGMERALRNRRDHLRDAAAQYYRLITREADVHGTDASERALVQRSDSGVEVTMTAGSRETFRRLFVPGETDEVRIYLHDGADTAISRGTGSHILVRLVGKPSDVLLDSSGEYTRLYHDSSQAKRAPETELRKAEPPPAPEGEALSLGTTGEIEPRGEDFAPAPRNEDLLTDQPLDWGNRWITVPWAEYHPGPSLIVGMETDRYGYAFRGAPYHTHLRIRAGWSFGAMGPDVQLTATDRQLFSVLGGRIDVKASRAETVRFFGFGNETALITPGRNARDLEDRVSVETPLFYQTRRINVSLGPMVQWRRPRVDVGSLMDIQAPLGVEGVALAGLRAALGATAGSQIGLPGPGGVLSMEGTVARSISGDSAHFFRTRIRTAGYYTSSLPHNPTLMLRAGAQRVWGVYPFQESAVIGGEHDLRGYDTERFRGDAAAYVGSEARASLIDFKGGNIGLMTLADFGRVYLTGETSSRWHFGYGGGVWAGKRGGIVGNLVASRSVEKTIQLNVYLGVGF